MIKKLKQINICCATKNIQILDERYEIVDGQLSNHQPNHLSLISPGDDYTNEDSDVKYVCDFFHTPEVVAAHKTKTEEPITPSPVEVIEPANPSA